MNKPHDPASLQAFGEDVLDLVSAHFLPEDVFEKCELVLWAEESGYTLDPIVAEINEEASR